MKRIAASPILSLFYYIAGYIAFQICMVAPDGGWLWFKLLPMAGIFAHSESLKDWRDRWLDDPPQPNITGG